MNDKEGSCLFDIKTVITEIETFIEGRKNFSEYKNNRLLKRGIERNLEIIGEATNRLSKMNSDILLSNNKKIIGLRNQIIHSYDNITDEMIWAIVINDLPKLKIEVENFLNQK